MYCEAHLLRERSFLKSTATPPRAMLMMPKPAVEMSPSSCSSSTVRSKTSSLYTTGMKIVNNLKSDSLMLSDSQDSRQCADAVSRLVIVIPKTPTRTQGTMQHNCLVAHKRRQHTGGNTSHTTHCIITRAGMKPISNGASEGMTCMTHSGAERYWAGKTDKCVPSTHIDEHLSQRAMKEEGTGRRQHDRRVLAHTHS